MFFIKLVVKIQLPKNKWNILNFLCKQSKGNGLFNILEGWQLSLMSINVFYFFFIKALIFLYCMTQIMHTVHTSTVERIALQAK